MIFKRQDSLVLAYIFSRLVGPCLLLLGLVLAVLAITSRPHASLFHIYAAVFGIVCIGSLISVFIDWLKLLRGRILHTSRHNISPKGGEAKLPDFFEAYEVWVFTGGWHVCYHGEITLLTSAGGMHRIKLKKIAPIFRSMRRDPTPFVIRVRNAANQHPGESVLRFNLVPVCAESNDERQQVGKCNKPLTIVIKTLS